MPLAEHERQQIESSILAQRQSWQNLNDLMRENMRNHRRYEALEVELKKTEREIARLESLLSMDDYEVGSSDQATPEPAYPSYLPDTPHESSTAVLTEPTVSTNKASSLPLGFLIVGVLALVALLAVGLFFLVGGSSNQPKPPTTNSPAQALPDGSVSKLMETATNLIENGNFVQDLENWEDKTTQTAAGSTRAVVLESVSAADKSNQRTLQLEHSGQQAGYFGQTVVIPANRNLTFSAYIGGRADQQASQKQAYAFLLVQFNGKSGALGGVIYQAAASDFNEPSLSDRTRYRVLPLTSNLTKYSFDLQSEANRLKINLNDIESVTVQVQAGAVLPDTTCGPQECKAEIQAANIQLR